MIWIKLLIVAILITTFLVAALGLKLLFDKNAEFTGASCHLQEDEETGKSACGSCKVKKIIQCDEKPALSQ